MEPALSNSYFNLMRLIEGSNSCCIIHITYFYRILKISYFEAWMCIKPRKFL